MSMSFVSRAYAPAIGPGTLVFFGLATSPSGSEA
jgi:hypothetical protein